MRFLNLFAAALLLATTPAIAAPKRAPAKIAKPAARPAVAASLPNTPEAQELRRAFRFAFPIYEIMRTRSVQLARAESAGLPNAVNFILPKLTLADASSRDVTTPNNDTLYGSAWLDLAAGPVILNVPALPGRYNSAALMSVQTDNTAIIGTRTGGRAGRYAITGPGYTGPIPLGTERIESASNDAWLLIRVLVNGPKDLEAAARALDGFSIATTADRPLAIRTLAAPANPDAKTFLAVVNQALARSAANPDLTARAANFTTLAANPNLWAKYLPALRAELKSGLTSAGTTIDGWSYPDPAIGEFGDNDDLRSYVALGGLGALPRVEAMYLTARNDKSGAVLDGSRAYTVKLPANIPVAAFWSLTMYQQEPDGRLFFVANSLNRFAIGDRSRHLRAERDGSYDIFVQATQPEGERVVNWLPAPKGKFVLVFRAYLPRAPLLDGSFHLPPIEQSEVIP